MKIELPEDDENRATPLRVYQEYVRILPTLEGAPCPPIEPIWAKDLQAIICRAIRNNPGATDIRRWQHWFWTCSLSPFLMGYTAKVSETGFTLTLDWLCKPTNLRRVREGFFNRRNLNHRDGWWVQQALRERARLEAEVLDPATRFNPIKSMNAVQPELFA